MSRLRRERARPRWHVVAGDREAEEAAAPEAGLADEAATESGGRILYCCAACGNCIAAADDAIEMRGEHVHRCINPAGIVFVIACFRHAPGCVEHGPPSAEHSWFPGHHWRIALCGRCGLHLGWRYGGAGDFFGLIREQLLDCRQAGDLGG